MNSSQVPARIVIGPHLYRVLSDAATARQLRAENRQGDSSPDDGVIRVDPDRPRSLVAETLLHEALHCAWAQTSLAVTEGIDRHQEAVVSALAPILLGMLRAPNPTLGGLLTVGDPDQEEPF